jgi:hypothetical protein
MIATLPNTALQIYDEEGNMIWAGLRLRIGIAYGYISSKKPLNTGMLACMTG